MQREWKQDTIVKPGGVVEVVVADLAAGQAVEVVVRANGSSDRMKPRQRRPGFGADAGLVRMSDDFDAPLEEFRDYM